MSLLYYILLRADFNYRGEVFFLLIQWIWFGMLPLTIIQNLIFKLTIEENTKLTAFVFGMITTLVFNYMFYYKEANRKKILMRYTYKYSIIDNYPIYCFFISYSALISLGLFLFKLLTKSY